MNTTTFNAPRSLAFETYTQLKYELESASGSGTGHSTYRTINRVAESEGSDEILAAGLALAGAVMREGHLRHLQPESHRYLREAAKVPGRHPAVYLLASFHYDRRGRSSQARKAAESAANSATSPSPEFRRAVETQVQRTRTLSRSWFCRPSNNVPALPSFLRVDMYDLSTKFYLDNL